MRPRTHQNLFTAAGATAALTLIGTGLATLKGTVLGFHEWPAIDGAQSGALHLPTAPAVIDQQRQDGALTSPFFTTSSGTRSTIALTLPAGALPARGAGAGGTLGAALVAKSPADGYTLLVHSAGHLVNPALYPNLSYDTLKDFAGITALASLPNVLVTAPGRFKDVRDLVEQAKARPGTLNYGSAGNGSATHMNAEVFRFAAGIQAQHVPFKGTPEALNETMAGRIDWFFAPMVSALSLVQSGKLKALAVGTAKRSDVLAQVPTTVEAGVPGSEYLFWVGLFAPARTPAPVVDRLYAEVATIMTSADMKERLDKLGAEPFLMAPAAFDRFVVDETARSQQIVHAAGIKVN
jgi:tripartite-type tricarboxylate transporter receptor subunit TctC